MKSLSERLDSWLKRLIAKLNKKDNKTCSGGPPWWYARGTFHGWPALRIMGMVFLKIGGRWCPVRPESWIRIAINWNRPTDPTQSQGKAN